MAKILYTYMCVRGVCIYIYIQYIYYIYIYIEYIYNGICSYVVYIQYKDEDYSNPLLQFIKYSYKEVLIDI